MLESSIEHRLVERAKKLGVFSSKFVSPSNKGVPDRIFIANGNILFLELKAPGKKPTPLQFKRMKEMSEQGARVRWTDDVDKALSVIDCMAQTPSLFDYVIDRLERP